MTTLPSGPATNAVGVPARARRGGGSTGGSGGGSNGGDGRRLRAAARRVDRPEARSAAARSGAARSGAIGGRLERGRLDGRRLDGRRPDGVARRQRRRRPPAASDDDTHGGPRRQGPSGTGSRETTRPGSPAWWCPRSTAATRSRPEALAPPPPGFGRQSRDRHVAGAARDPDPRGCPSAAASRPRGTGESLGPPSRPPRRPGRSRPPRTRAPRSRGGPSRELADDGGNGDESVVGPSDDELDLDRIAHRFTGAGQGAEDQSHVVRRRRRLVLRTGSKPASCSLPRPLARRAPPAVGDPIAAAELRNPPRDDTDDDDGRRDHAQPAPARPGADGRRRLER